MNLNRRFFVLNAITVLTTVLLTALAVIVFIAVYTRLFDREADLSYMKRVFEVRAGFNEIKKKALTNDLSRILDKNYQSTLAAGVKALGADAVIFRNREILFTTKEFSKIDIEKCFALSNSISHNETLELDSKTYIFDRMDFKYDKGGDGTLFLLAPVNLKVNFYRYLIVFTLCIFVVSFLGMNLWVSIVLSKGIISPVSRLRTAAARISEGDLSCEIVEEGDGEVRELSKALEQMRIRLKESVYLQEKYDDNRKFLVSSISHDLKTPVTSIKGYIEGIIDGVAKTPEKLDQYLQTAREKAVLVNHMIDDLLLYSKLDLNQIPYNFEKTDLLKYFEYCVADNKNEFDKANIDIALKNELNDVVFVLVDKERLKRVVQNILDNAKKYMARSDGKVTIMLRETRTSAIVEIRDNGCGIPEADLSHIFDRFYRADTSRKSTDGSGLGLAIAKQIVEGHEGKIWAVSSGREGTGIIISLKKY